MIENVIGTYELPLGIAANLIVDGREVLVPMVVEEPSVVAATSNAARIARAGGGFHTHATAPIMLGQVQITHVVDPAAALAALATHTPAIIERGRALLPRLVERGGGLVAVSARALGDGTGPDGHVVVVHLHVDCRDAMGANLINTLCEALAPMLAELTTGRIGLRILSNLTDERLVTAEVDVPVTALHEPGAPGTGAQVADAIAAASRFAELDPYRAATHNKGIMNGVDAALLATGQDWRAVEAGAHAFAARSGRYAPLAVWTVRADTLHGALTMPLALGTVGGTLHVHPTARLGLRLIGATSATDLARVIAAVGLATNLAALRALATEGIQRGHMALHARAVARAAGAAPDQIEAIAAELAATGDVKLERARALVARATSNSSP